MVRKESRQFYKAGKADGLILTEGSRPRYEKASVKDPTGVEERGIGTKG